MSEQKQTKIPLSHIRTTYNALKTQLREKLDDETVKSYTEDVSNGDEFPPIQLVQWGKRGYLIADGWHRYTAHKEAGKKKINAIILPPLEGHTALQSAIYYALQANQKHGLRLTTGDKGAKARSALLIPSIEAMTDRAIATMIGVSHQTVNRARNELARLQLIPHPATKEPVCDCTPYDYVGVQVIKEVFEDTERFKSVLSFVRRLKAVAPNKWAYELETDEVVHFGLDEGKSYRFSIEDNEVVDGRPIRIRESNDNPLNDEIDLPFSTHPDRDLWAAMQAKKEFEAAAKRIKATGKKDLVAAVDTLMKYRETPGLFADINTMIRNGGPANEHHHSDF